MSVAVPGALYQVLYQVLYQALYQVLGAEIVSLSALGCALFS
jgi:hypothetical protein